MMRVRGQFVGMYIAFLAITLNAFPAWALCVDCGTVVAVNKSEKEGDSKGITGAVAGGALGGLLGNQVGKGTTRDVATIAGVVGGAYLGNKAEKSMDKKTVYEVVINMEDNTTRTLVFDAQPGYRAGDKVRIVNGQLQFQQ